MGGRCPAGNSGQRLYPHWLRCSCLGETPDLSFLHHMPTSPCPFPNQSCGAPHNFVSTRQRGDGGKVQASQPRRGMRVSRAHDQSGLCETLLGADARYAADQPPGCREQGDVAGRKGPLGSVQSLYSLKGDWRTRFTFSSITAESGSFWSNRAGPVPVGEGVCAQRHGVSALVSSWNSGLLAHTS